MKKIEDETKYFNNNKNNDDDDEVVGLNIKKRASSFVEDEMKKKIC